MNKLVIHVCVIPILAVTSFANGQQEIRIGSRPIGFKVKVLTGKAKDKELPTAALFRDVLFKKPTVLVFTRRKIDDPTLQGFLSEINTLAKKYEKDRDMIAAVVVLPNDKNALKELEEELEEPDKKWDYKHVTLTAYGNAKGPPEFKIRKEVELKVVMSVDAAVKFIHEFEQGKLDQKAIEKVLEDSYTILK